MLLATVFVACSDDDDDDNRNGNGGKQKLVSKLVDDYGNGETCITTSEYENKTNYDFNWQLIQVWEYDFVETSYFGVKSKNLIASVTEGGERYTYEYTFDKDGYVTTIKAYDESGVKTLDYTTTVTYKE